jgi:3-methylcrotonyl-CoA carboxylase alpha subunit
MEIRLRIAGRPVTVRLIAEGDAFTATVDENTHHVSCVPVGPRTTAAGASVEELALTVDGRTERAVVARTRDHVLVAVDGRVWRFETGDEGAAGHQGGAGSGLVIAPMPGKVIDVLVGVGDVVTAGQGVVVLEAMKMESTLAAEVSGTVTAVRAATGAVVGAGDTLVEIEPARE